MIRKIIMKYEISLSKFFLTLFLGILLFFPGKQLTGKIFGSKYFKNYYWRDYGHSPQNWMIARDSRGILYSANTYGILEFDGTFWRFYQPQLATFTSIVIDDNDDDKIYVAGQNQIGVLTLDSKGRRQYTSLLDELDDKYKTEDHLIKGCQSRVWLHADLDGDKIKFTADSDAVITKGIIALMIRVLNNQEPKDIVDADLAFIDEIGLKEHLSPTRSNGLVSMVKQMKLYALALQTKLQDT